MESWRLSRSHGQSTGGRALVLAVVGGEGELRAAGHGPATLRTGDVPPGAVDQFGGHGTLARELETLTGAEYGRNIGFVALPTPQ